MKISAADALIRECVIKNNDQNFEAQCIQPGSNLPEEHNPCASKSLAERQVAVSVFHGVLFQGRGYAS